MKNSVQRRRKNCALAESVVRRTQKLP